ncbi:DEAD/DEAH box helicase family protein [Flavobacterium terrisoli]|uniref:DEAD/DEAH box helicase family protein n=1 Tax=Flavobacterium terrisoli TaxID=3242195 RepID=UPI0025439FD7|nr:DEAD/DEAH box helicase family protein [Flavobacterium buctense]
MIQEIKTYNTADLVLKVSHDYDPTILKLNNWSKFLDNLCGDREYQKLAIKNAVIYLASKRYNSINDLVIDNWKNPKMHELKTRYNSIEEYSSNLQLPHKLSASIDLATGTGKSYVMYGVAQIMLGLGLVERVLVLCPSLTIESGLIKKFETLASDATLLEALPEESIFRNPSIKAGDVTIQNGDICIENIHAIYDKTGSSIKDSFLFTGNNTLVLNDESHHIYNATETKDNQNLKRWKEFLLKPEYNFHYIIGFTGTAYIKDNYFNDVIYRYSLREAVNDKMVKMVDYVSKNDDAEIDIKFQEIYDNHIANKSTYRKVKPLTILIAKDILNAKRLATDFKEYLEDKHDMSPEECEEKVLLVTSAKEHKLNVRKLDYVDDKENAIEWIVSVSMLTEGWDVKNVFQIVPWEDRAFNSKLLISQVLGRGLRIPPEYQSPQPKVRVYNHDSWSKNIRGLVDEILEIEMRLTSSPCSLGERSKFHFNVYQINYEKEAIQKESNKTHQEFDYTKGYIELQSQIEETEKETEYTNLSGEVRSKNTLITYNTYTVDWIVNKIHDELKIREWEGVILKLPAGSYSKENLPPKSVLNEVIRNSMTKVGILGDRLIEKNMLKILSSFNTLLRKSGKTTVYERKVKVPFQINTSNISRETIAVGNLRHNSTVFHSNDFMNDLKSDAADILNAVIEDETFPKSSSKSISSYLFKTPLDVVFTKAEPERRFVEKLCKLENSEKIEAWLKSKDSGFYSIEYSMTSVAGKHSKNLHFNPDFLIKLPTDDDGITNYVIVEIKADSDLSLENKAKLKYGRLHFETLNKELKTLNIKEKYHFHFISPNSYDVFFDYLRDNRLVTAFTSDLELKLDAGDYADI